MPKLSDYVVQFVADQGVKHVFVVTGGGAMHLNESLSPVQADRACLQLARTGKRYRRGKLWKGDEQAWCRNGDHRTRGNQCNYRSRRRVARFHPDPIHLGPSEAARIGCSMPKESRSACGSLGVQEVDIISIVKPLTKYAVTIIDPRTDSLSPRKSRASCHQLDGLDLSGSIFPWMFKLHRLSRIRSLGFKAETDRDTSEETELARADSRNHRSSKSCRAAFAFCGKRHSAGEG